MEAVKPIVMERPLPIEKKDIKMIDIKPFDINLDNKLFILEFGKSEDKKNIIFKMYINNKLVDTYYLLYLNVNEFYNLNVFFRLYQTIDEIYDFLLDILINKKYSVLSKDNEISLILQFNVPGGKLIDINFKLIGNKIKKEDLIEKLFSIVEELFKENKKMKEEFDNEIKNLKNENIQIKNELKNINEYISNQKKEKEEEEEKIKDFDKSKIIKNKEEKYKLKEWISTNGNIKKINLIYRATEDGDTDKEFFSKCGEKGPTLSLIKTKKGRIFGGFSKAEWTNKKGVVRLYDNNAFLFSLDNMKKYKILKPELAIYCFPEYDCLVYGNNQDAKGLFLHNNFLKFENQGTENNSSRVYDVTSDYCLSNEEHFSVEEVEVYQIIFN